MDISDVYFFFLLIALTVGRYRGAVELVYSGCEGPVVKVARQVRSPGYKFGVGEGVKIILRSPGGDRCELGMSSEGMPDFPEKSSVLLSLKPGDWVSLQCIGSNYFGCFKLLKMKSEKSEFSLIENDLKQEILLASDQKKTQSYLYSSIASLLVFFEIIRTFVTSIWRKING